MIIVSLCNYLSFLERLNKEVKDSKKQLEYFIIMIQPYE